MKAWFACLLAALALSLPASAQEAKSARSIIAEAVVLTDDSDAQVKLVASLTGMTDPEIEPLLNAWKEGTLYLVEDDDGKYTAVTLAGDPDATKKETALRLDTKEPLKDGKGAMVRVSPTRGEIAETDSRDRKSVV